MYAKHKQKNSITRSGTPANVWSIMLFVKHPKNTLLTFTKWTRLKKYRCVKSISMHGFLIIWFSYWYSSNSNWGMQQTKSLLSQLSCVQPYLQTTCRFALILLNKTCLHLDIHHLQLCLPLDHICMSEPLNVTAAVDEIKGMFEQITH